MHCMHSGWGVAYERVQHLVQHCLEVAVEAAGAEAAEGDDAVDGPCGDLLHEEGKRKGGGGEADGPERRHILLRRHLKHDVSIDTCTYRMLRQTPLGAFHDNQSESIIKLAVTTTRTPGPDCNPP